jgi:hypothetical protein
MRRLLLPALATALAGLALAAAPGPAPVQSGGDAQLEQLLARSRSQGQTWADLTFLCDQVGHRLAGSAGLERAVTWGLERMQAAGVPARLEPVQVPVWRRGAESLTMHSPLPRQLGVLGLGGTIAARDLRAEVVVVHAFEELGPQVKGRIVLYNAPMEPGEPTIDRYGPAVRFRGRGAVEAAKHGAVGVLVRSVTTRSLYTPHTGGMGYQEGVPKIPAAAISTEDADWIDRLSRAGVKVEVELDLGAEQLAEVLSHNVVGELKGGRWPEQIVLVGAHLDSWDVGQGAHDDGAGVVQVLEVLRQIKAMGTPGRTVRGVLYTNEENGLRGGKAYAQAHAAERHVAAIETDLGGGWPLGWGATGSPAQLAWLRKAAAPLGLPLSEGGGGADIGPLGEQGALLIGLRPDDSRYFDVHHTQADTLDKVDPTALSEGAAALSALVWRLAQAEP